MSGAKMIGMTVTRVRLRTVVLGLTVLVARAASVGAAAGTATPSVVVRKAAQSDRSEV